MEDKTMGSYKQLSYGSVGDDVKKLQEKLNEFGKYGLETDGIYGAKTKAAVEKYQAANNLTKDGIAGKNTLGLLYSTNTGTTDTTTTSQPTAVQQAQTLLDQVTANKPGEYTSTWKGQTDALIKQLMDRGPFSYDINNDPLWEMYKDQATTQGKMAMMDTMGQVAALSGGYSNSYAQAAGQQAYNAYLQQLNQMIPQLQEQALNRWNAEGDALLSKASIAAQQEALDRERWNNAYNQWLTERDHAENRLDTERNWEYQLGRDAIEDERWERQYADSKRYSRNPRDPGVDPLEGMPENFDEALAEYKLLRGSASQNDLDDYLQDLVDLGIITKREATEIREWR
jgi:peptidoglycan hydrolase-like protein with peptidoglycan-binding domain